MGVVERRLLGLGLENLGLCKDRPGLGEKVRG